MDAATLEAVKLLYLKLYEHEFPLSDATIRDAWRTLKYSPSGLGLNPASFDERLVEEMRDRAKAFGGFAIKRSNLP